MCVERCGEGDHWVCLLGAVAQERTLRAAEPAEISASTGIDGANEGTDLSVFQSERKFS